MTKAALLLAMVSGFMLAAGAANAATLPKGSHALPAIKAAIRRKSQPWTNAWRAMVPITISPSALRN